MFCEQVKLLSVVWTEIPLSNLISFHCNIIAPSKKLKLNCNCIICFSRYWFSILLNMLHFTWGTVCISFHRDVVKKIGRDMMDGLLLFFFLQNKSGTSRTPRGSIPYTSTHKEDRHPLAWPLAMGAFLCLLSRLVAERENISYPSSDFNESSR